MKNLFFLLLLVIAVSDARAQKATGGGDNWAQNSGPSRKEEAAPAPGAKMAGVFTMDYMTMDLTGNTLSFGNVPDLNSMTLYITDGNGNQQITKKLSRSNSKVDVARLHKGLYFVTLTSENSANRKSFTFSKE